MTRKAFRLRYLIRNMQRSITQTQRETLQATALHLYGAAVTANRPDWTSWNPRHDPKYDSMRGIWLSHTPRRDAFEALGYPVEAPSATWRVTL